MLGANTQQNLRKYIGAIKDSTSVGLVKVNSEYKDLDIAVVKATNHFEDPPKEKHIKTIFAALSPIRPRSDVLYCIQALSRRLAKTHNWAVALKTLIVIHRALREVDSTFHEELINYGRNRCQMLNLTHFRDDSSHDAWEYSTWVRRYALFLEERLECFRVLKYDIEIAPPNTRYLNAEGLFEQLPALQQLLFRLLECEPQGASKDNVMIQQALSMVAGESIKIYKAITDGASNLADKFFEMQRHTAVRALEIYKRTRQQVDQAAEFYEACKRLNVWHGESFIMIEQSPALLQTMEEHMKNANSSTLQKDAILDQKAAIPREITTAREYSPESNEDSWPSSPREHLTTNTPVSESPDLLVTNTPVSESPDLLGLGNDDASPLTELGSNNTMAFDVDPIGFPTAAVPANFSESTGLRSWELDLVTTSTSIESASISDKSAGGLDRLTLDSLYEEGTRRVNQNSSYNTWEVPLFNGNTASEINSHQFYPSNLVVPLVPPPNVQMYAMSQEEQAFLFQQQMNTIQQPSQTLQIPFGNANASAELVQNSNKRSGLL